MPSSIWRAISAQRSPAPSVWRRSRLSAWVPARISPPASSPPTAALWV
nr:MAG TPA: hypothetical protein [Caudoviricetes sp.]